MGRVPLRRFGRRGRRAPATLIGLVVIVAGYTAVRIADLPHRGPPRPPPGATDPLNPGILVRGGFFWMGTRDPDTVSEGPYVTHDESYAPRTVPGFWMQEHEVTNAEYRRFDPDHAFPPGRERHPVVHVTLRQALAYAESIGGTLPTETQWEFAARGTTSRVYPWGDDAPTCERAQYGDCAPAATLPVLSRPLGATPDGIHDLAGNVWEWVVPDWFDPPSFPINDESRRLRGGCFRDAPFFLRAANRNRGFPAGTQGDDIGFRVVWPLERGR